MQNYTASDRVFKRVQISTALRIIIVYANSFKSTDSIPLVFVFCFDKQREENVGGTGEKGKRAIRKRQGE